jgi:uncharacterized protein (DUF952 family)
MIYHVTTEKEWAQATASGAYTAPSLQLEGFIHCSEENQVKGVLERYYAGKTNLVLLVIDAEKLRAPLRYELAPSVNEEFPHIYGNINTDAVVDVKKL